MPNTDKSFKWNDQNVIDFAYSVRHNDNFKDGIALSKGTIDELAKEFKQSKSPVLDYEILSYTYEGKTVSSKNSLIELYKPPIHQVKRLSDNEVFSVGEKVNYGEIEKFFIGWAGMEVHFTDGCGATLRTIERKKKPLFTTEDKVDIYEGDEYVKVNDYSDYSIVTGFKANGNHNDYRGVKFSSKEAAKKFVLMNKPCLSLQEIVDNANTYGVIPKDNEHYNKLLELAKQKINGV